MNIVNASFYIVVLIPAEWVVDISHPFSIWHLWSGVYDNSVVLVSISVFTLGER
jgi:hypothetical protein